MNRENQTNKKITQRGASAMTMLLIIALLLSGTLAWYDPAGLSLCRYSEH